jgi:hypothetical protein
LELVLLQPSSRESFFEQWFWIRQQQMKQLQLNPKSETGKRVRSNSEVSKNESFQPLQWFWLQRAASFWQAVSFQKNQLTVEFKKRGVRKRKKRAKESRELRKEAKTQTGRFLARVLTIVYRRGGAG